LFASDQLHCHFAADPLLRGLRKDGGGRDSADTDEPPWQGRRDDRFADPHLVLDCSGRRGKRFGRRNTQRDTAAWSRTSIVLHAIHAGKV